MRQLKEGVLQRLRSDEHLQLDIAKALVKRVSTIKSWARYNDQILTSRAVVLVIMDLTGLSEVEILEGELAGVPA